MLDSIIKVWVTSKSLKVSNFKLFTLFYLNAFQRSLIKKIASCKIFFWLNNLDFWIPFVRQ